MLKGRTVNLRIVERENLPVLLGWDNNLEFAGKFEPLKQETRTDLERTYDNLKNAQWFFVEKKDGSKVGFIAHFLSAGETELGYSIIPCERNKGYVGEAIQIMVDYLFSPKT
jgi:RimJ/RimL family protein N-acetyltransferase